MRQLSNEINWQDYLSQFDLIYESPSRVWPDGFALGNGSLGAMAYEPFHLEWTINKNDVWDYRHPHFKRHDMQEIRKIAAQEKDYAAEMNKENGEGMGLYPCPKTCGQLRIRFGYDSVYAPGHRVSKRLCLYEGTLHTNLDKHLSHPRVTSFVCADEDLLVVTVRDVSAMTAFNNKVDLYRVPDALMPACRNGTEGDTIWLEQAFHDGFRYVLMVKIVPVGTCAYGDLFRATVQKKWWHVIEPSVEVPSQIEGEYAVAAVSGDFDVYATVVTTRETDEPMRVARERLAGAAQKGVTKLHEAHRRWWAQFWPRSYVGLGDSLLEQLWYVSLYHLGTVLRGTPVGGLCGLWYGSMDTPSQQLPWLGHYTNDYNAQAPVAGIFRANHLELAEGSFRTLLGQLAGARKNAKELYGLPGAFYPLSADPSGEEVTSGPYRFCQNSGPEWCVLLWKHYLYTRDNNYLRQVSYPILREVATFFVHYLQWHEAEQLYHLEISQNPELMYIKYPDPVYTLTMLKYTLQATIQAAEILLVDEDLRKKCRHILDHYPEYVRHGLEISPLRGLRANHINHFRTLAGIFPCGELDPVINPEWLESCRLEIDKADAWMCVYGCNEGRRNYWTGGCYHIGVSACWLGLKQIAWRYLEDLIKCNVKPNGLITHNGVILADSAQSERNIQNIPDAEIYHDLDTEPLKAVEVLTGRLTESTTENLECKDTIFPALEGPAIYLLMLGEMLLQSHNGVLRLFAGLPEQRDASFRDLRAEGPILVSSARVQAKVLFVRIKALAAAECKLINLWPGSKEIWRFSTFSGRSRFSGEGSYIELDMSADEEVVLAITEENLDHANQVETRKIEKARARKITFEDGMVAWLGKPEPSVYYSALEEARVGGRRD